MKKSSKKAIVAVNKVRSFFSRSDVSRVTNFLNYVVENSEPFFRKPSLWTAVRAGASVVQGVNNYFDTNPHDYFYYDNGWVKYCDKCTSALVIDVINSTHLESYYISTTSKLQKLKIVQISPNMRVGWVESTNADAAVSNDVEAVFTDNEEFHNVFTKLLYKRFHGKSLVLLQRKGILSSDSYSVQEDDLIEALPSELASRYVEYFSKCFAAGVNRSLLLYGPPGTGKSTMAKQISKELKLTSMRVRVEDLEKIDNNSFHNIIKTLNPECIILDDFDRGANHEFLFETLTFLRKSVKLVIATANNRSQIDEALMRPQRFDELGYVKALDDVVIKKMLGSFAPEVFEDVKDWPIVFIEEYVTRRKFQSHEEARVSMLELADRVERLKAFEDEDKHITISRVKDAPRSLPVDD